MTRQKYHLLLFFFSIPFPLLLLFKTPLNGVHDSWAREAYPYLVLFAALAEIYFSRNKLVRAGMIGLGVLFLGILLHIPHWPGDSICILAGIITIMIIPIWSALTTKEPKALRMIISIWILIYGIGTIFKIFHWPGAGLVLILSIVFLPVVTIATGISLWNAKQQRDERNI